ncbi:type II TA system antitoxin MqsA family protein [Hymenobacter sp.]|jgi:putative zinc finger/helix-turn-helix YgiT family protein|uniref:type II TA system antitoxin MqsA family protein n=1 Tax=Hymenobacter sp. TaxID=1898978 RepID=UPI002ED93407
MIQTRIPSPLADGYALLRQEPDTQAFRKEEFSYMYHCYECQVTQERFTTPELDNLNTAQIYNQYREKHQFLFPEQIAQLRERYGLTAARLALLLDFGPNQLSNYEAGEMPSASNAKILRLASDPVTFLSIVRDKKDELRPNEYEKLRRLLDTLIDESQVRRVGGLIVRSTPQLESDPDQFTGYVVPDAEKFAELVLFFFQHIDNLFKVKLLKLLFYCDFQHYRLTAHAITGQRYRAIQHGPVPQEYGQRLQEMVQQDLLAASFHESLVQSDNGSPVLVYKPKRKANLDIFSASEREVIELVYQKLGKKSRLELENLSHTERAWKENKAQNGRISYQEYAYDLRSLPLE